MLDKLQENMLNIWDFSSLKKKKKNVNVKGRTER